MASFFAQDQWTMGRLTVQGGVRYDHPWSWFPAVDQPKGRFFPGAHFDRADGVTGYNDITPRMGAAYDLFGNGRTSLKVNLGRYLQGASVGNLLANANPSLRIPGGAAAAFNNPNVVRTWTDANRDFVPDCDLTNPLAQNLVGVTPIDPDEGLLRSDQQPVVRLESARRRELRSGCRQRVGRAAVGLVVRHVDPAAAVPEGVGRSRLLPSVVHDVHHGRHGDRQPERRTERSDPVHPERD
jgi:hypothetical protein